MYQNGTWDAPDGCLTKKEKSTLLINAGREEWLYIEPFRPACSSAPFLTQGEMTRVGTLLDFFYGSTWDEKRGVYGSDIPDAESVEQKRIVLAVLR